MTDARIGSQDPIKLHPEVARFAELLRRIEVQLATNDAADWAIIVGRCRFAVEKSDAWGLHGFLGMCGGMGTLNDVVLHRDGKMLTTENDQLHEMLEEAWRLGEKLQREEP